MLNQRNGLTIGQISSSFPFSGSKTQADTAGHKRIWNLLPCIVLNMMLLTTRELLNEMFSIPTKQIPGLVQIPKHEMGAPAKAWNVLWALNSQTWRVSTASPFPGCFVLHYLWNDPLLYIQTFIVVLPLCSTFLYIILFSCIFWQSYHSSEGNEHIWITFKGNYATFSA